VGGCSTLKMKPCFQGRVWFERCALCCLLNSSGFSVVHSPCVLQAKESTKMAAARVSTEVQKRGLLHGVKARAKSLWAHIDEVRRATHARHQIPSRLVFECVLR